MEDITFEIYKKRHPVDEQIWDKQKEIYNEFFEETLPIVLKEKGIEGDIATLKLPRRTWHGICCNIILLFPGHLKKREVSVRAGRDGERLAKN